MLDLHKFLLCSMVFGVAAMLTGCGRSADKPSGPKPVAVPVASHEGDKSRAEKTPGLAELSAADRAIAEKQRVCPVSGERLGLMGKPIKIMVKGETVFLCCSGCEAPIKKDPDKYLQKLNLKAKDGK